MPIEFDPNMHLLQKIDFYLPRAINSGYTSALNYPLQSIHCLTFTGSFISSFIIAKTSIFSQE